MADGYESEEWTAERTGAGASALDFSHLCNVLDPSESETTLWHKIVDRKAHIVLFFQVQYQYCKPRISRCVRLTGEKLLGLREVLKPTVCLGDQELPASFVESIFGRSYLISLDELSELLKVVECADLSEFEEQFEDRPGSEFKMDPAARRLNAILSQPSDSPSIASDLNSKVFRKGIKTEGGNLFDQPSSSDDFSALPQMSDDEEEMDEVSAQSETHEEGNEPTFEVIPQLQAKQKSELARSDRGKRAVRLLSDQRKSKDYRKKELKLPFSATPPADLFVLSSSFLKGSNYWRQPGEGRVQLRSGYDVYVNQTFLEDLKANYGPQKYGKKWGLYCNRLLSHLLGGFYNNSKMKKPRQGITTALGEDTLNAFGRHIGEVFGMEVSKEAVAKKGNNILHGRVQNLKEREARLSAAAEGSTESLESS